MAKINFGVIKRQVAKQARTTITKRVDGVLERRFSRAKDDLIKDIVENPLSQELAVGSHAEGESGTMSREGNLYSFFGFDPGINPIDNLIHYLLGENVIKRKNSKITGIGKNIRIKGSVTLPTLEDIEKDRGASFITNEYNNSGWIRGLRRGYPNYGKYIFDIIKGFKASRTGTGLQIKGAAQGGQFFPKSEYLSKELENFKRKIRKG